MTKILLLFSKDFFIMLQNKKKISLTYQILFKDGLFYHETSPDTPRVLPDLISVISLSEVGAKIVKETYLCMCIQ